MFGEETKTGKHNRVKTIRKKGGESGGGGCWCLFFGFGIFICRIWFKKLKVRKFRV